MERADNKNIFPKLITVLYIVTVGLIFTICFMLLRFPDSAGRGVTNGIELCVYTLIPSMFPFMFLSTFLIGTGLLERTGRLFSLLTERIFKLPGVCAPVILLSMIGGLPLGGKMTEDLYSKGLITQIQGQRMLFFCINPGPAFIITSVGYYMLGSKTLGIIIYVSLVLSSLILGILSSFVWSDGIMIKTKTAKKFKPDFQGAVVSSVSQSGHSMLIICAWVILFSCLNELIGILSVSDNTKNFLFAVFEITNGCKICSEFYPVPLIAGIIGFSGLCAHMQVMPAVFKVKLELKYFISARILNAGLSVLITMLLMELFPVSVQTVSLGSIPKEAGTELSLPICVGVMIMCILLLLGDNYRIKKYDKKVR